MFSMGRFDPRQVDDVKHQFTTSTREEHPTFKKRPRTNENFKDDRDDDVVKDASPKNYKSSRLKTTEIKTNGDKDQIPNDDDDSSSSSVLSSTSESSSSVPSSDKSDDEGELGLNQKLSTSAYNTTLKVIAPEQKGCDAGIVHRKRSNLIDELIDDMGGDDDDTLNPSGLNFYNNATQKSKEIEIALKVSKLPIQDAAKIWNLAPFLIQNLEQNGFRSFFPIQALVIPDVIASERHLHIRNRDTCVSAPTGSGKTLAFVLPVLNSLAGRRVRRLRALVVLPSRDLARQVYDVFHRYSQGSDLSIGLSIGQTDFTAEQCSLVAGKESIHEPVETQKLRYALKPFSAKDALHAFYGESVTDHGDYPLLLSRSMNQSKLKTNTALCPKPYGGSSAVDVLVCTPGRLMEHLDSTPGFTLQHLRFLVIDEADRLLTQSYQNWIQRVVQALVDGQDKLQAGLKDMAPNDLNTIDPVTWRNDFVHLHHNKCDQNEWFNPSVCQPVQLRKMLFSATLTKDPRKLASLGLINPKHYDAHHIKEQDTVSSNKRDVQGAYSLPQTLEESMVECTAEQKPLVLLSLILEQIQRDDTSGEPGIVVVFTSSVDSTHRLARLLQLLYAQAGYGPSRSVAEFSSVLTQNQRSKLMLLCKSRSNAHPRIRVIVCSDGMSRGMDIHNVTAVINYDVPSYAKTYVHRCGRTARAGKSGRAVTIVKGGQVGKFKKMRQLIDDPDKVVVGGIKKELVVDAVPVYKQCVRALQIILDAEDTKEMSLVQPLETEWMKNIHHQSDV